MRTKRKNIVPEEQPQQQSTTSNELQQPPRMVTQIVNGQQREYHYLKTVKSFEELDTFRIRVKAKINMNFKHLVILLELLPI
jgi:hypothetical protein